MGNNNDRPVNGKQSIGGTGKYKSRRQKYRTQLQNKSKNKKPFIGLNKDELEGIVIKKGSTTSLPQQFDALYNAVLIHAGGRKGAGGNAKKSILTLAQRASLF